MDQGAESALLEEKETEAQEVKPTRSTSQSQFISELRLEARSPDSSPGSFPPQVLIQPRYSGSVTWLLLSFFR